MHALKPLLTSSVPEICVSKTKGIVAEAMQSLTLADAADLSFRGVFLTKQNYLKWKLSRIKANAQLIPTATVLFPTVAVCL